METKNHRQPKGTIIIGNAAPTVMIDPFTRKNGQARWRVSIHWGRKIATKSPRQA